MSDHPIKRLTVDALLPISLGIGVEVSWQVQDAFCRRPLSFDVLYGRTATDTFKVLERGLTDVTSWVDPIDRQGTLVLEPGYYALRVQDTATGEKWYSPPQASGSNWTNHDWRICREIVRQERVRLTKCRAGSRGFLVKARTVGEPCSCANPDTKQVYDPSCGNCYGTGFGQGYLPPIECYVDQNPDKAYRRLDPQQGLLSEILTTWRVLAYPRFEPRDFWVDANTGERWRIGSQIQTLAQRLSVPIIQQLQVTRLEPSRPEYNVPVGDGSG